MLLDTILLKIGKYFLKNACFVQPKALPFGFWALKNQKNPNYENFWSDRTKFIWLQVTPKPDTRKLCTSVLSSKMWCLWCQEILYTITLQIILWLFDGTLGECKSKENIVLKWSALGYVWWLGKGGGCQFLTTYRYRLRTPYPHPTLCNPNPSHPTPTPTSI